MRESDLRSLFHRLGINIERRRVSSKGFIEFPCPLAVTRHKNGRDRRASAAVKVVDGGMSIWACQGCHAKGPLPHLVSQVTKLKHGREDTELVEEISTAEALGVSSNLPQWGERQNVVVPPKPLDEAVFEGLYPPAWEVPEARAYLESRGIVEATAAHLELAWDDGAPDNGRQQPEPRVLFPVRGRMGELYGWTGRAIYEHTQPKIRDFAGLEKRSMVLGCHLWQTGLPVFLVEGLFGFAHLINIGADLVCNVGALMGSVLTPEKADLIRRYGAPTYLLLDNDTAGDFGTFGPIDDNGYRRVADGAVAQLRDHVPLFLPQWPAWPTLTEQRGVLYRGGTAKDDPDQLTLDEVTEMLAVTPLHV